jgi:putative addiction module component (TIGR02574 family)
MNMEPFQTTEEIKKLSVAERIMIVEEIRDSIYTDQESLKATEAEKHELDRRLDAYHASPEDGSSWEEVKQRVTAAK